MQKESSLFFSFPSAQQVRRSQSYGKKTVRKDGFWRINASSFAARIKKQVFR